MEEKWRHWATRPGVRWALCAAVVSAAAGAAVGIRGWAAAPASPTAATQGAASQVRAVTSSPQSAAPVAQPVASPAQLGLVYSLEVRREPRPLRLHHLRVDLQDPRVEVTTVLAADPDGNGPATAELTWPQELAQRAHATALVNCNPWQAVPDASGARSTNWHPGMAVQISGLAADGAGVRNKPGDPAYCSVWTDRKGALHIGKPPKLEEVRAGAAGFLQLLEGGRELSFSNTAVHPRTALGLDAKGRFLHLVVADGRQSDYSEGLSYAELASYMRGIGCATAVNLDGGGSSIMMLAAETGGYRVMNSPSTKVAGVSVPRPIPIGLVIRARAGGQQ